MNNIAVKTPRGLQSFTEHVFSKLDFEIKENMANRDREYLIGFYDQSIGYFNKRDCQYHDKEHTLIELIKKLDKARDVVTTEQSFAVYDFSNYKFDAATSDDYDLREEVMIDGSMYRFTSINRETYTFINPKYYNRYHDVFIKLPSRRYFITERDLLNLICPESSVKPKINKVLG